MLCDVTVTGLVSRLMAGVIDSSVPSGAFQSAAASGLSGDALLGSEHREAAMCGQ
jgi:hypothetical protein